MSYLLDKKTKQRKFLYTALFVIILLVLFYFRSNIFNSLATISHTLFRPVLTAGENIGGKLENLGSYFISKNSLFLENKNLKSELDENGATIANYNSVLEENISLKEILGRKNEKVSMILSAIISKPNKSPYDTIIIDTGAKQGIKEGDTVFALGNLPIGRIANVYQNSSKVILFSNSGERTQVIVLNKSMTADKGADIFMEVVGRGGGNFEMILPRDFTTTKGDEVILPGIIPYVLAKVETVISDPRDPFIKALLVSPVNIQELKFVQVELQK